MFLNYVLVGQLFYRCKFSKYYFIEEISDVLF